MATQSKNPLARFVRTLFGFPEGQPGSCACSGGSAAGVITSPPGEKPAAENRSGDAADPGDAASSGADCCGPSNA